jgi:hypothetical protein
VTQLDEKGFVFLDGRHRPFLCRMIEGQAWLCFWHPDNHWVTLRQVTQQDVWSFPKNLNEQEQAVYFELHEKYLEFLREWSFA